MRLFSGTKNKGPETDGIVIHWAAQYDLLTKILFLGKESSFREATLDLAPLEVGHHVLDVGCGPGTLALAAKSRVGDAGVVWLMPKSKSFQPACPPT